MFKRSKTIAILSVLSVSPWCISILAAPTQQEVFKSIQDNVGSTTDPKKFFAFLIGIVALCMMLAVLSKRKQRQVTPKTLNHPGKLLREVTRRIDLRPAELKQLKVLADSKDISSPLTLLICPSVLAKAVKDRPGKVDRKVMMAVAKKLS
jgi:hypothetical protein